MLIVVESIAMCFVLLIVCVAAIANGPVGGVMFYEKDVQERVVELGYTTKAEINRRSVPVLAGLLVPMLVFVPAAVWFLNGARGFWELFWHLTAIYLLMGSFDRIFIDWYWVGHTKAWHIPGTEDLMPYIPKKAMLGKWVGTVVGFPIIAAVLAGLMTLLFGQ